MKNTSSAPLSPNPPGPNVVLKSWFLAFIAWNSQTFTKLKRHSTNADDFLWQKFDVRDRFVFAEHQVEFTSLVVASELFIDILLGECDDDDDVDVEVEVDVDVYFSIFVFYNKNIWCFITFHSLQISLSVAWYMCVQIYGSQ